MASFLSEEELIKALEARGTYVVRKKSELTPPPTFTSTPREGMTMPGMGLLESPGGRRGRGRGARAKEPLAPAASLPLSAPVISDPSTPLHTRPLPAAAAGDLSKMQYITPSVLQKSSFSGDDMKGDVPYMMWRSDIFCLARDPDMTPHNLLHAIRNSLRGTAKNVLVSLGDRATPDSVLTKLDALFGDVSTKGMLMQEFFNSSQMQGESVTSFGCRLESLLQRAVEHGHLALDAKNDLLRAKFWTALSSERLKGQTRHKYDAIMDFDVLLKEIRIVEKELSVTSPSAPPTLQPPVGKQKHTHTPHTSHQPVVEDQFRDFERKFDRKLSEMEKRINEGVEGKFNLILQKLDHRSGSGYFRPNYNRNRNHNNRSGNNNNNPNKNTQSQHKGQNSDLNG